MERDIPSPQSSWKRDTEKGSDAIYFNSTLKYQFKTSVATPHTAPAIHRNMSIQRKTSHAKHTLVDRMRLHCAIIKVTRSLEQTLRQDFPVRLTLKREHSHTGGPFHSDKVLLRKIQP